MEMSESVNVLGEKLETCGKDPITGFYRDGCCNVGPDDFGLHAVCAVVTDEFLEFSKAQGNDLSTPRPEFGFEGLKPLKPAVPPGFDCGPPIGLPLKNAPWTTSSLMVPTLADEPFRTRCQSGSVRMACPAGQPHRQR